MGDDADAGLSDWLEHLSDVPVLPANPTTGTAAAVPRGKPLGTSTRPRAVATSVKRPGQGHPQHVNCAGCPEGGGEGAEEAGGTGAQGGTADLNLASIRAVFKEEAAETAVLDNVVSSDGTPEEVVKDDLAEAQLDAFVLKGLLSRDECQGLISATEKLGFSFWNPVHDRRDYRNADTVEVTHQQLADALWRRLKHLVPCSVTIAPGSARYSRELAGTWVAVGMNPNMLFNRYGAGGHFSPHTDGYTVVDFNTRSMYSALIYLNDCSVGGATRMMEESGDALADHVQEEFVEDSAGRKRYAESRIRASVQPVAGHALFFFQDTLHEGEPVGAGHCKYIIRSDVMFERSPRVLDAPHDQVRAHPMCELSLRAGRSVRSGGCCTLRWSARVIPRQFRPVGLHQARLPVVMPVLLVELSACVHF